MRRAPLLIGLLAGVLALGATLPAQARRGGDAPRPEETRRERADLDEAVSDVRRDSGGRVLSARKRGRDADAGYRIKVLMPDATVRSFDVETRGRERRR